MKHFYKYDASGRIVSAGICQDDDFERQDQQGLTLKEGVAVYGVDYFDGTEVLPLPVRPSTNHIFDYSTKQWIDPRTQQDHITATRARRNALLTASDWTQLPDVPLATKDAWAVYRQALRDIANQPNPLAIEWPTAPTRTK